MRKEYFYDSCGKGQIHVCRWEPEGEVKAVMQIVHGISEYAARYERFAIYMNALGYLVVAEDHMGHGDSKGTPKLYFEGGWSCAVDDTFQLLKTTRKEFPDVPYVLFGHSMGSFMARTLLYTHPDSGIDAAIICGTGWMPEAVLHMGMVACNPACRFGDKTKPNARLQRMVFGTYNHRVEHPRTPFDWLNRDNKAVDAYIADPKCGEDASAGLLRDMLSGMIANQKEENLIRMRKDLPVHFIAGGDDPVGSYGEGVKKTVNAFRACGMNNVSYRIYPLCRHEILNEINCYEIYEDISRWLEETLTLI